MPIKLNGSTSGYTQIDAAAVASSNTLTLPSSTSTLVDLATTQTLTNKTINGGALQSSTAQASTSGTSIDFTSIPSWVKRITVMFTGVSTSGTSNYLIQAGSGSVTTSGYLGTVSNVANASNPGTNNFTGGFLINTASAANVCHGALTICLLTGNTYIASGVFAHSSTANVFSLAGTIALSGVLDRVRITTVNGTDTFDAGTINIQYE